MKNLADLKNKFGLFKEFDLNMFNNYATQFFAKDVSWSTNGKSNIPFTAQVDGKAWDLRVNNFPDEPLYTLLVDNKPILTFDDIPSNSNWALPAAEFEKKNIKKF